MTYYWVDETTDTPQGSVAAAIAHRFPDKNAAEEWLSENYENLVELGAHTVSLYEEDRLVYGPMSLDTED